MLRTILAGAVLLGTTLGAAALPAGSGLPSLATEPPATLVKGWKHGPHGWGGHHGRHLGWYRGRHVGWYRGRHRGWSRGRHLGWYRHRW